jgi:hypothetical protein
VGVASARNEHDVLQRMTSFSMIGKCQEKKNAESSVEREECMCVIQGALHCTCAAQMTYDFFFLVSLLGCAHVSLECRADSSDRVFFFFFLLRMAGLIERHLSYAVVRQKKSE